MVELVKPQLNDWLAYQELYKETAINGSNLVTLEQKREEIEQRGFLLAEYPKHEFESDINTTNKIFYLAKESGKLVGWIRSDSFMDEDFVKMDKAGKVIWRMPDIKPIYYAQPHAETGSINVSKEQHGSGIGLMLLNRLEMELRTLGIKYLFAFVATKPFRNNPSLRFHNKHGFVVAAEFYGDNIAGFEKYESLLFVKKL